jgi:hypothetical protein
MAYHDEGIIYHSNLENKQSLWVCIHNSDKNLNDDVFVQYSLCDHTRESHYLMYPLTAKLWGRYYSKIHFRDKEKL